MHTLPHGVMKHSSFLGPRSVVNTAPVEEEDREKVMNAAKARLSIGLAEGHVMGCTKCAAVWSDSICLLYFCLFIKRLVDTMRSGF